MPHAQRVTGRHTASLDCIVTDMNIVDGKATKMDSLTLQVASIDFKLSYTIFR